MANREHVKIVRQGAAAIAEWRRLNPGVLFDLTRADLSEGNLGGADLSGAELRGADLTAAYLRGASLTRSLLDGADLTAAILREADLSKADLSGAKFSLLYHPSIHFLGGEFIRITADLAGANLTEAILSNAHLVDAELTDADLADAELSGANLSGANLTRANLAKARLAFTSLGACDLSQVKGLSAVKHEGPSSIGVDTLIRSFRGAGNRLSPDLETFFLGAGVPKELLAALPRIVGAVEFYSCFISYGQPDVDFAKKLRDDLAARGVSCWLYALDATPGERTWKEIGGARRQADKMVVICSAAALIRDGVLKEIEEQIDEDPEKMVPISRDDIWIQPGFRVVRGSRDLGPFLRDRNYADFSDESRYEESLQRLLKALRRKAE